MTEPLEIEVFSDYVLPWCYLSTVRIERLKAEQGVPNKSVHSPMHPDRTANGRSPTALVAGQRHNTPKPERRRDRRLKYGSPRDGRRPARRLRPTGWRTASRGGGAPISRLTRRRTGRPRRSLIRPAGRRRRWTPSPGTGSRGFPARCRRAGASGRFSTGNISRRRSPAGSCKTIPPVPVPVPMP